MAVRAQPIFNEENSRSHPGRDAIKRLAYGTRDASRIIALKLTFITVFSHQSRQCAQNAVPNGVRGEARSARARASRRHAHNNTADIPRVALKTVKMPEGCPSGISVHVYSRRISNARSRIPLRVSRKEESPGKTSRDRERERDDSNGSNFTSRRSERCATMLPRRLI